MPQEEEEEKLSQVKETSFLTACEGSVAMDTNAAFVYDHTVF